MLIFQRTSEQNFGGNGGYKISVSLLHIQNILRQWASVPPQNIHSPLIIMTHSNGETAEKRTNYFHRVWLLLIVALVVVFP